MTQKKLPVRQIQGVLKNTARDHLVCRDLMHAWKFTTDLVPHRIDRKVVEVTRVLECLRCETTREDTYKVPSFERVKSRYVYPDGYLVHQGGHVPVTFVRSEIYRRMTTGAWK
jgi:hypothetical protein